MRMTRVVTALLAFALLGLAPIALSSSADAGIGKLKREITFKGVEPRPNKFIVKGRIGPVYENSRATMERKACGGCAWEKYKALTTDATSHFKMRVYGPGRGSNKTCYRVKVPSNAKFATTRSKALCIVKL